MAYNYSNIYPFVGYAVALGVLVGVIYDFFRIIRMMFTPRGSQRKSSILVNIIVFICDILFFTVTAVISAIFVFYVNNGRIRGIALFGSLIGFIAYYNSIGRLVTFISGGLIKGIHLALRAVADALSKGFKAGLGFIKRINKSVRRSLKRKES